MKALDLEELEDHAQPPVFSCSEENEPWAQGAAFQKKILEVSHTSTAVKYFCKFLIFLVL